MGLDWTEPHHTWILQEEVLIRTLQMCNVRKSLILHIRGAFGDKTDNDVYLRCLYIVRNYCAPAQLMHLHCFTGTAEQVLAWTNSFHSCFFGFTRMVRQFGPAQIEGLRAIPPNRLLLETDSPYFEGRGVSAKTPAYIGEVAQEVANMVQVDLETLLRITVDNAKLLYKI